MPSTPFLDRPIGSRRVRAVLLAAVDVIVAVAPVVSVPSEHGKLVVQAPLFETKAIPAGNGSLTETFSESDGPLFVTIIVYVAL